MSYDAERWARSQKVGNASAKFVLIELASALNRNDSECYPSIDTLEEVTELNRKTVIASTKLLEEKGFIKKRRTFENGKQRIYYSFPMFNPSEWALKQSSKNGTLESTKNGTHESTVFGPVTRNKNKEKEQGIGTGSVAPSPDHFPDATKKIEEPKATRAKPKTSCPFSPDDPIPPEYLEYAQAKHPSINAQTEFTKFVNFHLSKDNRYSNWLAAWRTWATKAEEFAKSRPQSQSYTPARCSTDPQAGWVSTQTPTNPPPLYTPEEREALKKKYQAMTAIFAKTDKNV